MSSDCKEPRRVAPVVDRNRCEGKADCVRVCPYDVFELRALGAEERASLSLIGRIESLAHRHRQAFVVDADRCHACGSMRDRVPPAGDRLAPR